MANKRFEWIYDQGAAHRFQIWVDTQTGVQYLLCGSGVTVLVGADGKPLLYSGKEKEAEE